MGSWHGDWGGWMLMTLMTAFFWGFVVWIVLNVVHRRPNSFGEPNRTPRDVPDERLARGEIDEKEHRRCPQLSSVAQPDGKGRVVLHAESVATQLCRLRPVPGVCT